MTWACGDCSTTWPEAVPTCIACLQRERDVLEAALRPFVENGSVPTSPVAPDGPDG